MHPAADPPGGDRSVHRRAAVVGGVCIALFFVLLMRLYAVQIAGHETLGERGKVQRRGTVTVETPRSMIRDAQGQVLAVSVPMDSVWADPSSIQDKEEAARLLAQSCGLDVGALRDRLSRPDRKFVWIKRKVSSAEADRVRALLDLPVFRTSRRSPKPKIGFAVDFDRRYPHGPLLGQILGFESDEPRMHEGVERSMAPWLGGGRKTYEVSVDGQRHALDAPPVEPSGADVDLSIDLELQRIVQEEMNAVCAEYRPRWAVAVVLDPRTGAVLAIDNRPSFDPNDAGRAPAEARRNRAITDPYEPGSTLKPFLAAFAMDLGLVTPQTKFDCENGVWKHGPRILHDHHPYGMLTVAEIIEKSSNIGAAKLGAITLGRERLYECMRRFGFGERTMIDLPAEDDGRLFPLSKWNIYSLTSVPIGHEIAVTPLQLAVATAAIANRGVMMRPYAIRRVVATDGTVLQENGPQVVRRVIGEKAARDTVEILKGVVATGTGKKAQVPGIAVAGKTGTSQKIDPRTKQYTHEKFISSFAGFAPADEARLCVVVVIDEPQGAYYGGTVAAPVVGRIIQRGLVHVK